MSGSACVSMESCTVKMPIALVNAEFVFSEEEENSTSRHATTSNTLFATTSNPLQLAFSLPSVTLHYKQGTVIVVSCVPDVCAVVLYLFQRTEQ
jgi:hypothetical protein